MLKTDLCPMCGVLQEMAITGFRSVAARLDGSRVQLLTRAYHCKACGCFVGSEEVADNPEDETGVFMEEED